MPKISTLFSYNITTLQLFHKKISYKTFLMYNKFATKKQKGVTLYDKLIIQQCSYGTDTVFTGTFHPGTDLFPCESGLLSVHERHCPMAFRLVPDSLRTQPVFLCIDDTIVPKSETKFEYVSVLFDLPPARTGRKDRPAVHR